jgi:hypothetical protein
VRRGYPTGERTEEPSGRDVTQMTLAG